MIITTTLEHFSKQFPKIEVIFDRQRTLGNECPVEVTDSNSIEQLSQSFLPWHLTPDGQSVGYDHPGARPVTLAEVPGVFKSFNSQRRLRIADLAARFRADGKAVFEVGCYRIDAGRVIVMDGCHRLSALMICQVPFMVKMWCVVGPLDARILPDLVHFVP